MAVPPLIRFAEFAISGANPGDTLARHLQIAASGFIKNVGTAAGEELDFGLVNNTFVKVHSRTAVVIMVVDALNGANEAIFNMRFWLPDISDYIDGTFFFNGFSSGVWFQNLELIDASGLFIPTALPSGQTLLRQDGFNEITGSGTDAQVSEFIYLSMSIDTDVSPGVFGGTGGGQVYRTTYDFR